MNTEVMDDPEKLGLKSEASLRLLIENLQDVAIFTLNLQGRLAGWNRGARDILGYEEAEFLGKPFSIIFTPEDRAIGADEAELQNARLHGRSDNERWHLRKDGTRFFVNSVLTLLRDEQDTPYGFAKLMRDLTDRKEIEASLQTAYSLLEQRIQERTMELIAIHETRRELIRKLVTTQEDERTRIARELHDQSAQQVTALIFGLNSLKRLLLSAAALESIDALIPIAHELMRDLHTTVMSLRPPLLDVFGLAEALQDYGKKWSKLKNIPVEMKCIGFEEGRLPSEFETTIYRVVQESLTNILRHAASATLVRVQVKWQSSEVITTIEDNGPGFDRVALTNLPPEKRRLGLLGMQERAETMGGTLTVESSVGYGTVIHMQLPLP